MCYLFKKKRQIDELLEDSRWIYDSNTTHKHIEGAKVLQKREF